MQVGIIGTGTMGSGIAQAFAACENYSVIMCDLNLDIAKKGVDGIAQKLERLVARGKIESEPAQNILSRIEAGTKEDLSACGLVMEAAAEKMEMKRELFMSLQNICSRDTIFATNTSSLSITEMSLGLDRQLIGMHFFNPADTMNLVEVICGINTTSETLERIKKISADIGKVPVEVKEAPGFVVNRILIPMINEAIGVLAEGIATAKDIDVAMKLGANHPMGPLALGDLIGLDICLAIMEILHFETGDDKYRPHPMLRKMVRGGLLGKKTSRGFFDYTNR